MKRVIRVVELVEHGISGFSCIAGAVGLCLIGLATLLGVIGRVSLPSPIPGTTEVSGLILAATIFLSLSYAQLLGKHVRMETVISHLSHKARRIIDLIDLILPIGLFVFMTWKIGEATQVAWSAKNFIPGLAFIVPSWPHQFCASIGCLLLCLALLAQIVRNALGIQAGRNRT